MCSFGDGDLDPDTARTCVGLIACCDGNDDAGTEMDDGNCERGMEAGRWDRGRLAMPVSILIVRSREQCGICRTVGKLTG